MRSLKLKIVLTALIILAAFSLTSCDDMDSALAEKVIIAWLSEGSEVNTYQIDRAARHLIGKAVNQSVERVTNTDASVQFDGLDVVEEMGVAENMADSALEYLDTARMASAVKMRPNDWRFQEKDGAVWLANGNEAAALTAFNKSDQLLADSLTPGKGDCPKLRLYELTISESERGAHVANLCYVERQDT